MPVVYKFNPSVLSVMLAHTYPFSVFSFGCVRIHMADGYVYASACDGRFYVQASTPCDGEPLKAAVPPALFPGEVALKLAKGRHPVHLAVAADNTIVGISEGSKDGGIGGTGWQTPTPGLQPFPGWEETVNAAVRSACDADPSKNTVGYHGSPRLMASVMSSVESVLLPLYKPPYDVGAPVRVSVGEGNRYMLLESMPVSVSLDIRVRALVMGCNY